MRCSVLYSHRDCVAISNEYVPYLDESRFTARGDVTRGRITISENCFFGGKGGGSVCKFDSGLGGGSGTISFSLYESLSCSRRTS